MSTEKTLDLYEDPARARLPETGIFVRALREGIDSEGNTKHKWDSVDISRLTKESLLQWLRSRGGDNPFAEDTVGILLGHGHLTLKEE